MGISEGAAEALVAALNASERKKYVPIPDHFVVRDDSFISFFAEPLGLANLLGILQRWDPPGDVAAEHPWMAEAFRKAAIRLRFEVERDGRTDRHPEQPFLTSDYGDIFRWQVESGKPYPLLMNGQVIA